MSKFWFIWPLKSENIGLPVELHMPSFQKHGSAKLDPATELLRVARFVTLRSNERRIEVGRLSSSMTDTLFITEDTTTTLTQQLSEEELEN